MKSSVQEKAKLSFARGPELDFSGVAVPREGL
jgi:hypothetical protein